MEEERNQSQSVVSGEEGRSEVEVKDRGLFDFMGKKKEKSEEEDLVAGMEKVRVDEAEDKKESFLDKLRRSHSSSSSSSSDEEEGGEGENKEEKKKKKKKGLKEKMKEKVEHKEGEEEEEKEKEPAVLVVAEEEEFVEAVPAYDDETAVTVEVVEGTAKVEGAPEGAGEKKGFLEKIKEKLPGHKKPSEEAAAAAPTTVETAAESDDHTAVDAKKGFLGKIMEKLPGYNKGTGEDKETEKPSACH